MRVETVKATLARVIYFENVAEYVNAVEQSSHDRFDYGGRWAESESWSQALSRARSGDTSLVVEAEALLDKITVEAQREGHVWLASCAGAYPVVPEAIAGFPEPMRRRRMVEDDRAPIRLYVDLVSSGGIPASALRKRGVAILALALLLNQDRAVELNVIMPTRACTDVAAGIAVVPLGQSPLDVALACNALTSPGFARRLAYSYMKDREDVRFNGEWAWCIYPNGPDRAKYLGKIRKSLGASEQDIIIPPCALDDEAVNEPLAFVKRSLAEALKLEQDAE